jgi:hypothetical protein
MAIGRRVTATLATVVVSFLMSQPARAQPAELPSRACAQTAGSPVVCRPLGRVVQLVAAGGSTCALTDAGDVYCWAADDPSRQPAPTSPLLLVTLGALLLAGGTTLLLLSRP